MAYRQYDIIKIITDRIVAKEYTDKLPRSVDLAEELHVSAVTVNKAILQLVKRGVLQRKRRDGTRIVPQKYYTGAVIEVLFDGFMSIFSHPFWHHIWVAMIRELDSEGFRAVISMLKSDPETGLITLGNRNLLPRDPAMGEDNDARPDFFPAVGRIILGAYEKRFLNFAEETQVPYITACDPIDPAIPQVSFDFSNGIHDAVAYLHERGCRKIGFIGQTQSLIHPRLLNKFNAYLNSVQDYSMVDPSCIGNTRPVSGGGAAALQEILKTTVPDALIVAYDTQLSEILHLLNEKEISIPVIGCDGLELPDVPANRPVVRAPLRECGRLVAQKIIQAVHIHRKPKSTYLKAKFEPGE